MDNFLRGGDFIPHLDLEQVPSNADVERLPSCTKHEDKKVERSAVKSVYS